MSPNTSPGAHMKYFKSITGLTFISSFVLSGILLVVLGYLLIQIEKRSLDEDYEHFKSAHIEIQKEIIRNEVHNVLEFIKYSKSLTLQRVKDDIQSRVDEAHDLATHLIGKYEGKHSKEEIGKIIIESLRPLRFNNGRGYYFITQLDGTEMLFADKPDLEGKNLLSMRDTYGKWVIKDMIQLARSQGKGFYFYNWSKPRHHGKDFPKIAYIKYFEPLNWLIGTGEYIDDTEATIREEVKERIDKIRFGKDGYVFTIRSDGTVVNHAVKDYIGQNLMGLTDANGIPVVKELIRIAKEENGGYLNYKIERPSSSEQSAKTSYVQYFKEWDWIIGAGAHLDDLDAPLQEGKERLNKKVKDEFRLMGLLFVILFVFLFAISVILSNRVDKGVKTFKSFFDKAAETHEKIDENKVPFDEFKMLASQANVMVENMAQADRELDELNQNLEHQVHERTAELERANRKLVILDEIKSDFISTVSHELRTPLTSILGFTKLITRDVNRHILPVTEKDETLHGKSVRVLQNLSIIEKEGARLTRLVSDVLDLSKIESGKMEWRLEEVFIDQCIGMAANSLAGQLDSNPDISLVQEIAPDLPSVFCDHDKITQVIINLAGNALKFSEKGRITIKAERKNGGVQVSVTDQGPGITPEDQEIIFDSFRQASYGQHMAKPSGSGLGLTISKQIIEHFGGNLWVESELGKGSCFIFTLPHHS